MFTPPSWRNPALCTCTCQFLADVILSEGECPSRRTTTEPAFPSPAQRSFDPIFHADQSSPVRRQRESRACPELAEGTLCFQKLTPSAPQPSLPRRLRSAAVRSPTPPAGASAASAAATSSKSPFRCHAPPAPVVSPREMHGQ